MGRLINSIYKKSIYVRITEAAYHDNWFDFSRNSTAYGYRGLVLLKHETLCLHVVLVYWLLF